MINTPIATGDLNTIPDNYFLYSNFLNPFNPSTTIKYSISKSSFVTIKVFNLLGQEVAVLLNQYKDSGNYSIDFTAANLSSGVYLYRLLAGDFSLTK